MECEIDHLPLVLQSLKPGGVPVYCCPQGHLFGGLGRLGVPPYIEVVEIALASLPTTEIQGMLADDTMLLVQCQVCDEYALFDEVGIGMAPCGHAWNLYRLVS